MSGDDRQNSPSISRQNRPSATDYLHGYQHHYERGWPGDKRILSVRCCDPEWHRYDAPAG